MRGTGKVFELVVLFLFAAGMRAQSPEGAGSPSSVGVAPDALETSGEGQAIDPPSRVVRLSVLQGDVSVEPASVNQFAPAEMN